MTLNCELCQTEFLVFSGSLIIKLSKIYFLCTYVDRVIIQERLVFYFKFSFAIFLIRFFPLFSKVFINILKIYELPTIDKKIVKKIVHNNHLACQFYLKDSFGTKFKRILARIFFLKM